MKISIYRNVYDKEGATGNLFAFLTTDKWKDLSLKIRDATDKDTKDRLKKQLPCCTPSGQFENREDNRLNQHSGFICIDIDGDDNPTIKDWESFYQELGKLNEVVFSGLSVSGKGAFCLIRISDPEQHRLHFKALEEDFLKLGIIIDPACINVSRLRFYAYNERPYINRDATTYTRIYKIKPIRNNFYSNGADVDALVKKIVDSSTNIVPDYNSWFECAGALANVSNGRELFHAISRVDTAKYNQRECDRQFDKIKTGAGININTLFYHAKINGITLR